MAKKPPIRTVAPTAGAGDGVPDTGPYPDRPPKPLGIAPSPPRLRPLKVYAFGPSRGADRGNMQTLHVPYEKLAPGPVGTRIAIVDYDTTSGCFYDPVDLDDPLLAMNGGLDPSESDPKFHQQMVYAVVSESLHRIEVALGRALRRRTSEGARPFSVVVYPHFGDVANAWSDGERIMFGYFKALDTAIGRVIPGQTVFTCLNQDVVSHHCAHLVLNALRPDINYSGDNATLQEVLADFTALLFHFRNRDVVLDTVQRTAGIIYRSQLDARTTQDKPRIVAELESDNPLIALSAEFGDAIGRPGGLRGALLAPDATAFAAETEPHARGNIVVAAIFDAMFSIYQRRTADLFRILRAGGGRFEGNDLPEPLALRLCDEVEEIATRFFQMCWRAIDYCPPMSVPVGDFLRACITADYDYVRDDTWALRDALMQAFRIRGIVPKGAQFFSEDTLRWPAVDPADWSRPALDPDRLAVDPDAELRDFVGANTAALEIADGVAPTVYPLEASRVTSAADMPQLTWSTQVLTGDGNGRTLVFDDSGRLRYALPAGDPPRDAGG
jgi:hypothetical protein